MMELEISFQKQLLVRKSLHLYFRHFIVSYDAKIN